MICSSLFTDAVPPRRDRSIHGVPLSVNGLVHSLSVHHLRGWTGSFAECTHFSNTLHAYIRTHVCTYGDVQCTNTGVSAAPSSTINLERNTTRITAPGPISIKSAVEQIHKEIFGNRLSLPLQRLARKITPKVI